MRQDPQRLCGQLGHAFADPQLLDDALTHRSAQARHNERLEFLGDAVLGFLVAEALWRRFPQATEGELSRLRARLAEAGCERAFPLGNALCFDALEAYVAACGPSRVTLLGARAPALKRSPPRGRRRGSRSAGAW